ncbi:MAG TPA: GDSL-type esterase/lipase family protein [Steroidobacteraceae bacterium]|jgi:cephalosporin-C deacetylase-like acetyl esterase/lysophospholipase L1-like esterase|nr:GDSL-type esterase/lipase family protein [Steroidobacteraceae bacterium]
MKAIRATLLAALVIGVPAFADESAGPLYVPYKRFGIYALGETAGWHVTLPWGSHAATYVIRENNLTEIGRGRILPGKPTNIEARLDRPGMVYVEVTEEAPGAKPKALGAAVAPEKIQPSIPAPADFDAFWKTKIATLRKVPMNASLTEKPSERDGVDFGILEMDHLDGRHVWGQVAKPHDPTHKKKYPGLVILQWASPPYPLQKPWVTDRAAEGWLAVNIEPHDVMPDQPQSYYDALPAELKAYNTIETRNRDKNYFLYMYLADIRAVDYLASRPDWDGKTLVVMGTSMGGQQSLCTAGLHPRVTAMLVNVPAGADANGTAHGRKIGYPFWDVNDPKVLETAQYFDTVNCAARIKVPSLVAMGFIDTVTPPVGIWAAFNQIQGPRQAAPMIESPHNHLATPEQSMPWTRSSTHWLGALVSGRPPIEPADQPLPRTDANSQLAHEQLLAKRKAGRIDVYFEGDSITRRWGASDEQYQDLFANWNANFKGWNAGNFGWGGDKTQNMLWRLRNGELDGVNPRVIVLMAGTNNIGNATPLGDAGRRADEVARGVAAVVRELRKRAPRATVIITGITPRDDNPDVMPIVDAANQQIATLADGKSIRYININAQLASADGRLREGMSPDGLHLRPKAYQVWADALKPILTEILGPPAAEDHAPPPTGDPSAVRRQSNP